tara:strand:- start:169 stop:1728 length:1560 start_codon:yes stop_codon:yes gene_type:complete
MKYSFIIIGLIYSIIQPTVLKADYLQDTTTISDSTKFNSILNTIRKGGKKGIQLINELLKRHKVPEGYIPVNSVEFVDRNEFDNSINIDSIKNVISKNSKKNILRGKNSPPPKIPDPKINVKVLYPKINKGKGYVSFQVGDFNYNKYLADIQPEDIEYIKLKSKKDTSECFIEKYRIITEDTTFSHYAFLLDHSGSMGKKRANVLQNSVFKSVSTNYTFENSVYNIYSLYKFDSNTGLVVSSRDINDIRNRFMPTNGLINYGGGTAMKDGLIRVISDLRNDSKSDNKVVVMFTDGDSNSDMIEKKMSAVISDALKENINIIVVGFGSHFNVNALNEIAYYSGGNLYHIYTEEEFDILFDNIFKDLDSKYDLEFSPCMFGEEIELEIKLKGVEDDPLVGKTVFRSPEEEGFAIDLNILFDVGKSDIKPEYYDKLNNLIRYMRYKDFSIRVEGHTDRQGNSNINKRISLDRANSVKKYIVSKGISESKVNAIGYGEDRPAYNYIGDSEVNELNRRIEIAIE